MTIWNATQPIEVKEHTATTEPSEVQATQLVNGNSIVAKRLTIAVGQEVMGVLEDFSQETISGSDTTKDGLQRALNELGKNKEIWQCIIQKESSWSISAVGDNGLAFSILQFHRATFNYYRERYGLSWLKYENPNHQIILAGIMVNEDPKNFYHWTTYKKCL